jgi:uncharacterized membrane protein YoaK (UPF0700 family)
MISPAAKDIRVPLVGESSGAKLLPTVLSVIAGSTDAIGFLGLGGLFTAHITGNLVILAAHVVTGSEAQVAPMLSVPMFMAVLSLTNFLGIKLEAIGVASLRPLLLLQFLLLAAFLALCVTVARPIDPNATNGVVAGMLGVSAMAVQSALVQVSLKGAPPTAVMTTNVARFTLDVCGAFLERSPERVVEVRSRAKRTFLVIAGFAVGCWVGAEGEAIVGLWSLTLPTGLALIAYAMACQPQPPMGGENGPI